MAASAKSTGRGQLHHVTPQLVLLVLGALLVTTLVVLALLSLAGWL